VSGRSPTFVGVGVKIGVNTKQPSILISSCGSFDEKVKGQWRFVAKTSPRGAKHRLTSQVIHSQAVHSKQRYRW
jgi:hypothetical protein